ncbi:LysR family transcriptional regulator (plasmid) [Rhodobacteraceae bacterium M382]|nr:LysR family transcriptional regulator [Rhodobacteraceae bacterium M382]
MRRRLPPLYSLRAFEAAARHSSFSKASNELNLTAAAIAHQVKKLEMELGVELFQRRPRGVELNEAGKEYLRIVERLLDDLTRETQLFKAQHRAQPIRIAALHVVSERLVRPLVQAFFSDHPDVRAELIADMVEPDFRSGNLDVVVWHGEIPPPQYPSIRIMSETLTPVCAPQLLESFPAGMTMEDVQKIPALYDLYWDDDWTTWLEAAGGRDLQNSLGFSLYSAMIQTVREGGGIAIGHTGLLEKELKSGQLVKPFDLEIPSRKSYFALTTNEILRKPGVAAFWEWLAEATQAMDK